MDIDVALEGTKDRVKADDRLAELYRHQGASATRLAYFLTGDRHAAEDISQEAFVRISSKLFTLRDPERFTGYLFRTVANLAKDHGRRTKRETASPRVATRTEAGTDLETRDEVLLAMMEIDPRHRLVLFLRYYLDLSERDAAETMGCSTSALKSLTNRAKKALEARLQGGGA